MFPHLTTTGRIALVAAITMILAGVTTTHWVILLWGESLVVLVIAVFYLQVAPLHAIEEGFVGLRLKEKSTNPGEGGIVGRAISLEFEVVNLSRVSLARLRLEPEHSAQLGFDPPRVHLSSVPGRHRVSFRLQVTAHTAGRWMIHGFRVRVEGLSGLVAVSDYIPMLVGLKFFPATTSTRRMMPRRTLGTVDVQRTGAHPLWQRGFGTNFRELRDHMHGDPFRSIAWKATARTGKLMVREFEDEIVTNVSVILDISATMRGGTPPRSKLDHSIELICEFASVLARTQDRLGLITFDEIVYGHLKTADARSLLPHLVNHLVGLQSVVAGDFTQPDDEEVMACLVQYLLVQERLDFRLPMKRRRSVFEEEPFDRDLLLNWLRRSLQGEHERLGDPAFSAGVVDYREVSGVRRFCQLRGLPLAYHTEARFGAKEHGMVQALERFLEDKRESHLAILLTDLCALADIRAIVNAFKVVLSRKHRVVVWMPYTPDYVRMTGSTGAAVGGDRGLFPLQEVFRLAEHQKRTRISQAISALGIPVLAISPEDTLDIVLARMHQVRRFM